MNRNKAMEFWREVHKRAWQKAWESVGMGVMLLMLILGLLALSITAFGVFVGWWELVIFNTQLQDTWTLISGMVLPILTMLALYVAKIYQIPAEMYVEKGGYEDNPFKVIPRPKRILKRESDSRYASIDIENTSREEIADCYVRLVDVINTNTGESVLEFPNHRNLCWGSGMTKAGKLVKEPLSIPGLDKRTCDVASNAHISHQADFTIWVGQEVVHEGEYKVNIRIYGQWKGRTEIKDESLLFIYGGGNDLEIRILE